MNQPKTSRPRSKTLLAFMLLAASYACGKAPKGDAAPVDSSSAETAAPVPKITSFGVPECDTYVKMYLACVDGHVSGDQKEKLMEAFEANQTKWRALATMREGAIALGVACRAATQKAKEALTLDYGCEF